MFKFVVLCAFVAVAAAKPGAVIAPIAQYSTVVSPASTSISQYDTSVIHPSPINYYSAPALAYAHFIKKRSPQFPLAYYQPTSYIAPSTYVAPNPYVATSPIVSDATILPAPISPALHLIKKRSAPLLSTSYFTPQVYTAASAPILTTSYASAAPLIPTTQLLPQPVAYTHLIKKRSAPLLNAYIAPASYSHQSRFDLKTTHEPLAAISYSAPIAYANNLAYSHIY